MATARALGDGLANNFSSFKVHDNSAASDKDGDVDNKNMRHPSTSSDSTSAHQSESAHSSITDTNYQHQSLFNLDLNPTPTVPSQLYMVTKHYIARTSNAIGTQHATIEPPAIRVEVLAVCTHAARAREIAQRAWRQSFAYAVPEGKVEEFDGINFERMFGDDQLELMRILNREFVDAEDGVKVLAGEKRVAVWRVRLDCTQAGEACEEDGAATPVSE